MSDPGCYVPHEALLLGQDFHVMEDSSPILGSGSFITHQRNYVYSGDSGTLVILISHWKEWKFVDI